MPRRRLLSLSACVFAASLCLPAVSARAQPPALATIGMIGDVARELVGDCVPVEVLIGGGGDPHLYQPTASDVRRMQDAGVILYLGFGLEGQMGRVLDKLSSSRPVVAVGPAAVPETDLIAVSGDYAFDPHLWMDPGLWARTVPVIAQALSDLAPDCAAQVADRTGDYTAQLLALDAWVRDSIALVPENRRVLVTAHDAFGYYARAYGLRQIAIQGLSTQSEASVADIRDVAQAVVASGVPAVFVETTINPRTVQAMIEAVAALGGTVTVGGSLYSDAMGDEGTAGGTYIGMIHANTVAIVTALGGTPAPLPPALAPFAIRWGLAP